MKKLLLIVPHQDDETDLAGNILDSLVKQYEVFVLYSSIDEREKYARIRKEEALEACLIYGVDANHVIFMDFPDTPNVAGKHFFQVLDGHKRVVDRLQQRIKAILPDIIMAVDFDYHSDHRMLSIASEEAIRASITKDYHPVVFKGFCYETAYYGVEDYKASVIGRCVPKQEPLSNASFEWENRISVDSKDKAHLIWNRLAYKALKKHYSQYAILHAKSIVNGDNVFWQKRTDNLLFTAGLTVSSGDGEKLRDFKVIDTDDIITVDPHKIDYSKAVWKPIDESPFIKASWKEPVSFDKIVFHGNPCCSDVAPVELYLYVNDVNVAHVKLIREYGRSSTIDLPTNDCSELCIEIKKFDKDFGLSEIEILNGEQDYSCLLNKNPVVDSRENSVIDIASNIGFSITCFLTKVRRKLNKIFGYVN